MRVVRLSVAVILRRPLIALGTLILALGVAACGSQHQHLANGQQSGKDSADANNNGAYVFAGPLTYQLQISRELNQYSTEDAQYVRGLPAGMSTTLPGSQMWYGVFLWAKNQTHRLQTTSDNFKIVDTQQDTYYPIRLDPNVNSFAWKPETLQPGAIQPEPDTIAGQGPTQGGLLLFKLNTSVYSNRPLTLLILGSDNEQLGSISLDL